MSDKKDMSDMTASEISYRKFLKNLGVTTHKEIEKLNFFAFPPMSNRGSSIFKTQKNEHFFWRAGMKTWQTQCNPLPLP